MGNVQPQRDTAGMKLNYSLKDLQNALKRKKKVIKEDSLQCSLEMFFLIVPLTEIFPLETNIPFLLSQVLRCLDGIAQMGLSLVSIGDLGVHTHTRPAAVLSP